MFGRVGYDWENMATLGFYKFMKLNRNFKYSYSQAYE